MLSFTVCSVCGTPMERNEHGQLYCPKCDPSEGRNGGQGRLGVGCDD